MRNPLLYVVILNNNRREDTLACLASVYQNDYKNFHVILLDNISTDGSIQAVRSAYADVEIIPLSTNLGYAGNNNLGIQRALDQGAEWILILNDDTVLDSTCLTTLMWAASEDPSVGIVGPMVYHFDEPDIIQSAGGVLGEYWISLHLGQNERDRGQFSAVHEVDWISGCAILINRSVVDQVGLLDSEYFLYWEETEWCIRASRAGWKVIHVPRAKLWHKGVRRDYQPDPYVTYYLTRNQLFTLAKHNAPFRAWIYTFAQIFRTLISWTIRPRWYFKRKHRNAMWRGLLDFFYGRSGSMDLR